VKTREYVFTGVGLCVCLLYGCESWVLYRRSVRKIHRIAGIKWQDRVPNTEVLHLCGITGIEAFILQAVPLGRPRSPHARQSHSKADPLWTAFIRQVPTMRTSQTIQGYCQGQFEADWYQVLSPQVQVQVQVQVPCFHRK